MAASSFDAALARVLAHEGGYSHHPDDPGGPTKYGITIADYRRYVMPDATAADVKAMPLADAKAIYRARYWDAQCCDDLPAGIDYAVFDYGVNSGIGRSGKVLRRVLHLPDDTSRVDTQVLNAACASDAERIVNAICDERMRFLQSLKTWQVFGAGWGKRVADVRAFSCAMTRGDVPAPSASAQSAGRGEVPLNHPAQQGSIGAVIVAGGTATHQAHANGAGHGVIVAIVFLTLALAVAAFLFWRWRRNHLQER